MLSNADMMLGAVNEAVVRKATAYSEHLLAARLESRARAREKSKAPSASGWKVWKRLGASRAERTAT